VKEVLVNLLRGGWPNKDAAAGSQRDFEVPSGFTTAKVFQEVKLNSKGELTQNKPLEGVSLREIESGGQVFCYACLPSKPDWLDTVGEVGIPLEDFETGQACLIAASIDKEDSDSDSLVFCEMGIKKGAPKQIGPTGGIGKNFIYFVGRAGDRFSLRVGCDRRKQEKTLRLFVFNGESGTLEVDAFVH
jgi:hypothetical protein